MFNFLKKRQERKAVREVVEQLMQDAAAGRAQPVDLALAIHAREGNQESMARIFMTLPDADLYTLNAGEGRLRDIAMLSSEAEEFVALFTSRERAEAGMQAPYDRVDVVSGLELIFSMQEPVGMAFNPGSPVVSGGLTKAMVASLIQLMTDYALHAGALYTVWSSGAYRVVKRPKQVDAAMLMLSGADEEHQAMGHLPFTRRSFLAMGPRRVPGETPSVTEAELEGHRIWEENQGGYFGG